MTRHPSYRYDCDSDREKKTREAYNFIVILVIVALPTIFDAIAILPEIQYSGPYSNDQVFHYLFIERADHAVRAGDNPFDHWLPELELGFPQFLYYQNLPHLTVVTLYRLLLEQVSLMTLLNVLRYLLLVMFPLTVYWSMRRMEFSPIASAVGAAFSPMLSSGIPFGFDFNSYATRGFGMFPQLCSMHLMFVGTACVRRVLEEGREYCAAIVASAAMVLSDLLYGYIFGIVVVVLWLLSVVSASSDEQWLMGLPARMRRSNVRLAIVAVPATLIAAYQVAPFVMQFRYVNRAQLEPWKYLPIPASTTLATLFSGHFFDKDRLPVVTVLVLAGVLYAAFRRPSGANITLAMLATWAMLFVENPIAHHLPVSHIVPFQRFSSGIDFGAILSVGLGGELLWKLYRSHSARLRTIAPLAMLLVLYVPAAAERWSFFKVDKEVMNVADRALRNDLDLPKVMSALRKARPGRVYAGTRGNWGSLMSDGNLHLYDLLPVEQLATVMPWQTLSLNSPYLWRLATPNQQLCRLYNIRYVVAPPSLVVPDFYRPLLTTERYVLYTIDSGGYMQLGQVNRIVPMGSSQSLFLYNRVWLRSEEPAESKFTAFIQPKDQDDLNLLSPVNQGTASRGLSDLGQITDEVVGPDSMSARVVVNSPAVLIFKVTYHPNWHVFVDGRQQRAFMVSPSIMGIEVSRGQHEIRAEYRSSNLKKQLLAMGCFVLVVTICVWALGLENRLKIRSLSRHL